MRVLAKITLGLSVLLCILHVIHFSQLVTRESSHWGVVYSKDNDSAHAVGQMKWTNWKTADSGNQYGPLFFRIAHLVQEFNPIIHTPSFASNELTRETSLHYVLMMVSLASFIIMIFCFAYVLGTTLMERLVVALIMTWALMSSATWGKFIYMAKPDMFLTMLIGMAMVATLISQQESENRGYLWIAAVLWGCAVSTKLTAALFMFPLVFLFIPPLRLKNFIKALKFYATAVASYFIVGIPQTLDIKRITGFMGGDFKLMVFKPSTAEMKFYFAEFWTQLWLPAVCILAFLILLGRDRQIPKLTKRSAVLWLVPTVALVYFLRTKWMTVMHHFYMPVVMCFLVLIAYFGRYWVSVLFHRLGLVGMQRLAIPVCFVVVLLFTLSDPIAKLSAKPFYDRSSCNNEALRVSERISEFIKQGRTMIGDPYVPYEIDFVNQHRNQVKRIWAIRLEYLQQPPHATVIATKWNFYQRYLKDVPGKSVWADHKEDWVEFRKFYRLLEKKQPFEDLSGNVWEPAYISQCGWELWTRQPDEVDTNKQDLSK